MKRLLVYLVLLSVPALMMIQVVQGYRYTLAVEEFEYLENEQLNRLEENRKILAGIAVYDAPARIYQVARESLGLAQAENENVIQVRFPDGAEVLR
jgi:cell division protein FtsL